ncbi:hypothetical protein ACE7GA_13230 [Roseomonas sp. CCTCC AB2023176]|uniref:hypothetical protein n=1 Tax=Roseomonas sp. CCTCC AB2023176 TaxID=3342640 RepID=UPI0035DF2DA4
MTRAVLFLGVAVALAACGRPGPPRPPGPPEAIIYPRVYPYEPGIAPATGAAPPRVNPSEVIPGVPVVR